MPDKLISELLDLPERVRKGDFVLNLSKGVTEPEKTLDAVRRHAAARRVLRRRPGLHPVGGRCREQQGVLPARQLRLGQVALHGRAAPAACSTIPAVRRSPNWPKVCAKHDWVEDKKFLLVPYHMIGARNMESAILGGYVDHVLQLHPDAPLPGVYLADDIFKNAEQHRAAAGRREVLRGSEPGREQGGGRLGLGQARHGLGRRPVRGGTGSPARQRGADPAGRRSGAAHLPGLQGHRPGQGRSLRRSRRGPEHHQRPRQVARLRRA